MISKKEKLSDNKSKNVILKYFQHCSLNFKMELSAVYFSLTY